MSERGWGPGFFFFGVGGLGARRVELRWGRMRVEEEEEEKVG